MRLTSASDAKGLTLNISLPMCNHDAVGSPDGMRRARQSLYGEAMIAVLFDFNGVLVDDEDVHFEAFRRILEVLGVTISHEVYRRYLGFDDRGTIVALLAHYGRDGDVDDGELGRLVARKQRSYARLAGEHPRLGFGARALVLALRAAGARLAIVSGARRAEIDAVLDASSLRECFDAIVAAEDVTRGKPDPEGYRLARARLDAVAGRPLPAVAIEDAPAGLRAARDAGARCIGLATTCPAGRARRRRRDRAVARRAGRAGVDAGRGRARPPRRSSSRLAPCACRRRSRARSWIRRATTIARRPSARCAPISSATSSGCSGSAIPPPTRRRCSPRPAPARMKPACSRWRAPGQAWSRRTDSSRRAWPSRRRATGSRTACSRRRPTARWIRRRSIARWRPRPSCAGCTWSATRRAPA